MRLWQSTTIRQQEVGPPAPMGDAGTETSPDNLGPESTQAAGGATTHKGKGLQCCTSL
jgi:hypothetical protein